MSRGLFLVVLVLAVSTEHGDGRGVVGQEYNRNGVGPKVNPSTGTSGSLSGRSGSGFGEDTKIGSGLSSSSGSGTGSTFGSGSRGSNFGSGSPGSTSQSGGRTGSGQFVASGSQTGSGSGQFVSSGQVNGQSNAFGSRSGSISGFDQFVAVPGGDAPFNGQFATPAGATITRVVQDTLTPTVTQTATVDRFVTLTDVAFQSVQVTLSNLLVRTLTARTTQILQTPVNDRIALQTTVVTRPSTLTLTQVQTDFLLVTAVSVDHVTLTHHSYVIRQSTFTTSATQVVTVTATRVRTIIHTDRITSTMYYTITDTVLVKRPQEHTRLYQ